MFLNSECNARSKKRLKEVTEDTRWKRIEGMKRSSVKKKRRREEEKKEKKERAKQQT